MLYLYQYYLSPDKQFLDKSRPFSCFSISIQLKAKTSFLPTKYLLNICLWENHSFDNKYHYKYRETFLRHAHEIFYIFLFIVLQEYFLNAHHFAFSPNIFYALMVQIKHTLAIFSWDNLIFQSTFECQPKY